MERELGQMVGRDRRLIGMWPTNDGLTMSYVAGPIDEFHQFRTNIEAHALQAFDLAGDLGERVRAATRAERWYGTADTGNYFRAPFGPGWALVGDAGLAMDPVTAQGISDAFRDAEMLAEAVATGLESGTLDRALGAYQRARDRAVKPMYDFTTEVASLGPLRVEQQLLYEALARDPAQAERFLHVLTGAVPVSEFFTAGNLRRLIGIRGIANVARSKMRRRAMSPASRGKRASDPAAA